MWYINETARVTAIVRTFSGTVKEVPIRCTGQLPIAVLSWNNKITRTTVRACITSGEGHFVSLHSFRDNLPVHRHAPVTSALPAIAVSSFGSTIWGQGGGVKIHCRTCTDMRHWFGYIQALDISHTALANESASPLLANEEQEPRYAWDPKPSRYVTGPLENYVTADIRNDPIGPEYGHPTRYPLAICRSHSIGDTPGHPASGTVAWLLAATLLTSCPKLSANGVAPAHLMGGLPVLLCPTFHPLKIPPGAHVTDGLRTVLKAATSRNREGNTPPRNSVRRSIKAHQEGATYRANSAKGTSRTHRYVSKRGVGTPMPLYPALSSPARSAAASVSVRSHSPTSGQHNYICHRNGRLVQHVDERNQSRLRQRLSDLNRAGDSVEQMAAKIVDLAKDLQDISKELKEAYVQALVDADMNGVK